MAGAAPLVPSAVDLAATARTPQVPRSESKERIAKVAREFEGMLMEQLMQSMRKTVEPSGLFGQEGQSRSTYEYLLDQAVIGKAVQAGKGFGLAAYMERHWADRTAPLPPGRPRPASPGSPGE